LSGISGYSISANGEKILYRMGRRRGSSQQQLLLRNRRGSLKLDDMQVYSDLGRVGADVPRSLAIERDFLYDPHFHGWISRGQRNTHLTSRQPEARGFEPSLYRNARRSDHRHMFIFGGDVPKAPEVKVGLLGADYKIENGRFALRASSTEKIGIRICAPAHPAGVDVKTSDYLLEVNGADVHALRKRSAF